MTLAGHDADERQPLFHIAYLFSRHDDIRRRQLTLLAYLLHFASCHYATLNTLAG